MRKWVLVLMMVGLCATMASAAGGLGIFGSYWDTKDLGPGFGRRRTADAVRRWRRRLCHYSGS